MKVTKLDLLIYVYSGKLTKIAYCISALIIIIPIFIVMLTGTPFNASFSKILMSSAFFFFILGKLLVIINNKKEDKSISVDVGIVTGLMLAYVFYIID